MKFKKTLFTLLILLAIIIVLSILSQLYVSYQKMVSEQSLEQSYQRTSFTSEELRQDVDFFRVALHEVHPKEIPSFPLTNINGNLQQLRDSISHSLSRVEFYRQFSPLVSAMNDEHVAVFPPETEVKKQYEAGGKFFPFDVQFINEQLYVAKNFSSESIIQIGAEILSINGISTEELRKTLIAYYSGTKDAQKEFYLQTHFREALFSVYGFSDEFTMTLRNPGTSTLVTFLIAGKPFSALEIQEFTYKVITADTILLTYNAFEDKNNAFSAFLQEMFTTAQQKDIKRVIIDIRNNQGGSSSYGDELLGYLTDKPFSQMNRSEVRISKVAKDNFMENVPGYLRWLPIQYIHPLLRPLWMDKEGETASISFDPITPGNNALRFNGDVYLLVGPGTMSSASLFAATVKKYHIGLLIGEETGGYATQYGNVATLYLPNTALKIWMPTSVNYGNQTGPVVPDYTVTQTVDDLVQQKDTVLLFSVKGVPNKVRVGS